MEKNGESFPILRLYFANINITHVWLTHVHTVAHKEHKNPAIYFGKFEW